MSAGLFLLIKLTDLICCIRVIFVSVLKIIENNLGQGTTLLSSILDLAGNTALVSILGARLLFNMKEAGEKDLNQGTSCGSKSTVSEIDFADAPQIATEHSQQDVAQDEANEIVEIV